MRIDKTVFISYRRTDLPLAILIFKDLTLHGYDVFIDYEGIASGDFEQVILENIRSRAHFLVVLTPQALVPCDSPGDWLRREVETAIATERNIVPLLFHGFTFSSPAVARRLTGDLGRLAQYNGLEVPLGYLDAAMARLRSTFLSKPLETVLHPASPGARAVATQQKAAAEMAPEFGSTVVQGTVAPAPPPVSPPRSAPPAAAAAPAVGAPRPASRQDTGGPGASTSATLKRAGAAAGLAIITGVLALKMCSGKKEEMPAPMPAPVATAPETPTVVSAEQQNARGWDYMVGRNGVAQSDVEAVKLFRLAAEQGHAGGQTSLGFMYSSGRGGLTQSDSEAVKWYRLAAQQGNAAAQSNLGAMYQEGRGGLAKSYAEAVRFYRLAADQGNAMAQSNLGVMYEEGRGGLAKSDVEAVKLYRLAADHGDAAGQAYLGAMYERGGGGLDQSDSQALNLYRLAAAQGNEYARRALERVGAAP